MRLHRGAGVLGTLGPELEDLHRVTATPVTARRPWLEVWAACYPYEPWAVTVHDGSALAGVALLAQRRTGWQTRVVAMGDGPSDTLRLPVADPAVAPVLAGGIADVLGGLAGPWWLTIAGLPAGDPVSTALAARLPHCHVVPAEGAPVTRIGEDRTKRTYVSRGHQKSVRALHNRLRRDAIDPKIEMLTTPQGVTAVWPEIERLMRERDRALGVASKLDHPCLGPFIRRVVVEHAARGQVEVATLRLQGQLAAYVVAFVDGDAYRMWSGRFDPAWKRYSPGRALDDALLERVLADPGLRTFDFMKGEEEYKEYVTNEVVPAETLHAFSGGLLERGWWSAQRGKRALKPYVHRHEPLRAAVLLAKRARSRVEMRLARHTGEPHS